MVNREQIERVRRELEESVAVTRGWSDELIGGVFELARRVGEALRGRGKLVLFGNGGSAADAQHIAAELIGRYRRERGPLRAMVLHGNTSALTAIANDYEWDAVFERQIHAWIEPQDVAIGITTSGNSMNVIRGLRAARQRGAFAAALTGEGGGQCLAACDLLLAIPSKVTPRIQESHITLGHILCGLVEESLSAC